MERRTSQRILTPSLAISYGLVFIGRNPPPFEQDATLQRMSEGLPPVEISASGFRQIHRHLFQDIYDWAGQDRSVQIAKGNSYFCRAEFIGRELEKRFAAIRAEGDLNGLLPGQFASRTAEHLSELNAIHPFREGNGRVQRAFLEILAERAGHSIDLTRIVPAEWQEASVQGFLHANYEPMRQVIAGALVERSPERGELSERQAAALAKIRERREENHATDVQREHDRQTGRSRDQSR